MPEERADDELLALARKRLGVSTSQPVERDDTATQSKHLRAGRIATRDLRCGRDAHVFLDTVDLRAIERAIWTRGQSSDEIRKWRRFWLEFNEPVGLRLQSGREPVPLRIAEIKARLDDDGIWRFHLDPRATPAEEEEVE